MMIPGMEDAFESWNKLVNASGLKSPQLKIYDCPVADIDCPYYDNGVCTIGDPARECDDYFYYKGGYDGDE